MPSRQSGPDALVTRSRTVIAGLSQAMPPDQGRLRAQPSPRCGAPDTLPILRPSWMCWPNCPRMGFIGLPPFGLPLRRPSMTSMTSMVTLHRHVFRAAKCAEAAMTTRKPAGSTMAESTFSLDIDSQPSYKPLRSARSPQPASLNKSRLVRPAMVGGWAGPAMGVHSLVAVAWTRLITHPCRRIIQRKRLSASRRIVMRRVTTAFPRHQLGQGSRRAHRLLLPKRFVLEQMRMQHPS